METELEIAKRRLQEEQESNCANDSDIAFWESEVQRLEGE